MKGRVLIISDVTGIGGVDTYIYNLLRVAIKEGWQVDLLLESDRQEFMFNTKLDDGINVYHDKIYHGYYDKTVIKNSIYSIIDKIRPDIVHVVCGSIRSALYIRELIVSKNIPLFFTEAYIDEKLELTDDVVARIRSIYLKAEKIIILCEANKSIVENHFKVDTKKVEVIPPGIVDEDIVRHKGINKKEKYKILCIGRLDFQKGFDLLIEQLGTMDREDINRLNVDIWGEGPERENLETDIREKSLENIVLLKGWCSKVESLFEKYDLFLFPSRCEGQPQTLIMALMSGIPCISSDVSGISELLDNEKRGTLFDINNMKKMEELIKDFCEHPDTYCEKAEIAYVETRQQFGKSKISEVVKLWECIK